MGWVPGEARRALQRVESQPGRRQRYRRTPRPGENGAGPTAPFPSAAGWSGQLRPTDGCPATGGISPGPLNGARQPEDLNTPTAGLDRGRRAKSTPPGPVRAACGELRRIRSGSIPSWGLSGERIILTVNPGNRDRAPRFLWPETLEKPDNTAIITSAGTGKDPLRDPPGNFAQSVDKNGHPAPLPPPAPRGQDAPGPRQELPPPDLPPGVLQGLPAPARLAAPVEAPQGKPGRGQGQGVVLQQRQLH